MIASGKKVEIKKDRSKQWYYVKYGSHLGWVKENSLKIPPSCKLYPISNLIILILKDIQIGIEILQKKCDNGISI